MEEKLLVFTQIVRTSQTEARTEGLEEETSGQDRELDRMVPMIIILSCLITVLVFVRIIVTLVKKSPEYGKNLRTHVSFSSLEVSSGHYQDTPPSPLQLSHESFQKLS